MPLITRENAAEMARLSHSPNSARHNERKPLMKPAPANDSAETVRRLRLAEQIDLIDQDIQNTRNPELRIKLISAKARLWELLYPKPGSLRPGKVRTETRARVEPIAQPVVNSAPLVVPDSADPYKPTE